MTMSETIDNAKLLEMNYNSQLDALREIGLLSDGEVIGLGEIADYMKWAGGLLDVQLAKADKSDGKLVPYSWRACARRWSGLPCKQGQHQDQQWNLHDEVERRECECHRPQGLW